MQSNQKDSQLFLENCSTDITSTSSTQLVDEIYDEKSRNKIRPGFMSRLYQKYFQPISKEERVIDQQGEVFPPTFMSNKANNRKYTILSMIPLFLFNEYKHFSNLIFLLMAFSQFFPIFKVGLMITYIFPICFILTLSFIKEVWDEIKRKINDDKLNREVFNKISEGMEIETKSENISVGDILLLKKNERVPADVLLLKTLEGQESGTAFVRTDQLDGETDWKVREPISITQSLPLEQIQSMKWEVLVAEPIDLIYKFDGTFSTENDVENLNLNQTIWANMKVASGSCLGLVIYTGKETRMSLNSKDPETKYGKTDKEINNLVKRLICILLIMTISLAFLSGKIYFADSYIFIIKTLIMFNTIIPISMQVNVQFAKIFYTYRINQDQEINGTIARNSNIPEELGRIEYLLSDKTGTLTKNEMIFQHLKAPLFHFQNQNFDQIQKVIKTQKNQDDLIRFLESFMVCNNINVKVDEETDQRYLQAASPDEVSLVTFAEEKCGYYFQSRTNTKLQFKDSLGNEESFEVLQNFPFSSTTKRMGIVVKKESTGELIFYLKGADSIIMEKISEEDSMWVNEEAGNLSKEGLRTLAFCYKKLSQQEYDTFAKDLIQAGKNLSNRELNERKVIEKLEKNMRLIGITGVEDLLQDDVKSTILTLRDAGIKVWMLTGDKLETAKCIAISTGFKTPSQNFFEITDTDINTIQQQIQWFDHEKDVLIVTGNSLEVIMEDDSTTRLFFHHAQEAKSVVLCRCAPKQKAEVTEYIKNKLEKVVCGIGDGGNDVGMIQCASVGVGIEGKEGLQASLASDYSVTQFNRILVLTLWHGRLSYMRSSLLSNFVVHRGLVITMIQALFMIIFFFVSLNIYNGWLTMCYATFFTNFPVFSLILDVDIPLDAVLNYPILYTLVQKGENMSLKMFLIWFWKSTFQASVIIILSIYLFENSLIELVTITFTALIFIEFLNIYSVIRRWHYLIGVSLIFSLLIYLFCLVFLKDLFMLSDLSMYDAIKILFLSICSWLPLQIVQTLKKLFFPSQIDKMLRISKTQKKRRVLMFVTDNQN